MTHNKTYIRSNRKYARELEWLALYNKGLTLREIAEQYDVSPARVQQILRRHPEFKPRFPARRTKNLNC